MFWLDGLSVVDLVADKSVMKALVVVAFFVVAFVAMASVFEVSAVRLSSFVGSLVKF